MQEFYTNKHHSFQSYSINHGGPFIRCLQVRTRYSVQP